MNRKTSLDPFGMTMLVAFAALVGLNQVLVKLVNAGLAPIFQAGLRSLFALIVVLLYTLWAHKKLSVRDGTFWPGLLAGIFFAGEFLFLFVGLDFTSVARGSLFFYTMPFWVALGAHFLIRGESLSKVKVFGLVLAIAGTAIALLRDAHPAGPDAFTGDVLCLLGAICWAGLTLVARVTRLKIAVPEMQLIYQLAVSAIILLPVAWLTSDTIREMTPLIGVIFAFQILGVVSVGFVVWFWLLTIYPASAVASFGLLAPVFGLFFAWAILGEKIGGSLILALALICLGIAVVNHRPSRPVRAESVAEQP